MIPDNPARTIARLGDHDSWLPFRPYHPGYPALMMASLACRRWVPASYTARSRSPRAASVCSWSRRCISALRSTCSISRRSSMISMSFSSSFARSSRTSLLSRCIIRMFCFPSLVLHAVIGFVGPLVSAFPASLIIQFCQVQGEPLPVHNEFSEDHAKSNPGQYVKR
jgi:hypothetical protein